MKGYNLQMDKANRKGQVALGTPFGGIPNRLQLAGGWIDQPFMSRLNPRPPGAMVVVQIEPSFRPMDRSGLATGTRVVANVTLDLDQIEEPASARLVSIPANRRPRLNDLFLRRGR